MKIRNHPKIKPTIKKWPPTWFGSGTSPTGEEGILIHARIVKASRRPPDPDHLNIEIKYQGNTFSGAVRSDDPDFIAVLCTEFNDHCVGMTIQDIGDRDVNF